MGAGDLTAQPGLSHVNQEPWPLAREREAVGLHRLAAVWTGHLRPADMAAAFVDDLDRVVAIAQPEVAPLFQRNDHRPDVTPHRR